MKDWFYKALEQIKQELKVTGACWSSDNGNIWSLIIITANRCSSSSSSSGCDRQIMQTIKVLESWNDMIHRILDSVWLISDDRLCPLQINLGKTTNFVSDFQNAIQQCLSHCSSSGFFLMCSPNIFKKNTDNISVVQNILRKNAHMQVLSLIFHLIIKPTWGHLWRFSADFTTDMLLVKLRMF